MGMNRSVISISDKYTIVYYCGFLFMFLIEGNSRFQVEVSENKYTIIPFQVHGLPEFYP